MGVREIEIKEQDKAQLHLENKIQKKQMGKGKTKKRCINKKSTPTQKYTG